MLWLRAYARKCQWDEEGILVALEMDSTVRYFGTQSGRWNKWSEGSRTPGHKAYALRQASMWERLQTHASDSFVKAKSMNVLDPDVEATPM